MLVINNLLLAFIIELQYRIIVLYNFYLKWVWCVYRRKSQILNNYFLSSAMDQACFPTARRFSGFSSST